MLEIDENNSINVILVACRDRNNSNEWRRTRRRCSVPQVIVFEYTAMDGQHKHYFASDLDLTDNKEGKFWNDQISSIVVISGNWAFLGDPASSVELPNLPVKLGPGVYPDVTLKGIEDNTISQIRLES